MLGAINFFKDVHGIASFDIFGPIEDDAYWRECQVAINELPNNITVEYKGLVEHDHVHEVFSQYDAFIFPTLSENYGHVIVESLMVGTPVIISDQTPWRNMYELGLGWDLPLNDVCGFQSAINTIIKANDNSLYNEQIRRSIKQVVKYEAVFESYQSLFCNIVSE